MCTDLTLRDILWITAYVEDCYGFKKNKVAGIVIQLARDMHQYQGDDHDPLEQYKKLLHLITMAQKKAESKSRTKLSPFPKLPPLRNAAKKIQCNKIICSSIMSKRSILKRIEDFATKWRLTLWE